MLCSTMHYISMNYNCYNIQFYYRSFCYYYQHRLQLQTVKVPFKSCKSFIIIAEASVTASETRRSLITRSINCLRPSLSMVVETPLVSLISTISTSIMTSTVSDLGFPSRGTICPRQQFSGGYFSFLGDTNFVF